MGVAVDEAARAEHDLAVALEQSVAQGRHLRATRADAQDAGALRLAGPAHGAVEGVGDGPSRVGHVGEQVVGVAVAEEGGDGVVVLPTEAVPTTAGHDVHTVAHVEQEPVGRVDLTSRAVREPRLGKGCEDRHVAKASVSLLEVGLDGLREVAVPVVAHGHGLGELGQSLARVGPPVVAHRGAGRCDDLGVPRDRRDVEQAHGRGEVVGCHAPTLAHGAHAVVEAHAGVPDRVPDAVGEAGDLVGGERPAVVQEHEVVVRQRARVTTSHTAHCRQGDTLDRLSLRGVLARRCPATRG